MDKTKTYVKMSDHPLIQAGLLLMEGDYYTIQHEHQKGYQSVFIAGFEDVKEHKRNYLPHIKKTGLYRYIILPRQDHVQGMCKNKSGAWIHLSNKFFRYYTQKLKENHGWFIVFDTREKAWLAYYMHEKHGLTWDGDKWQ